MLRSQLKKLTNKLNFEIRRTDPDCKKQRNICTKFFERKQTKTFDQPDLKHLNDNRSSGK